MAEYTYKDVITDPEDPRVEIGKAYYYHDIPIDTLKEANGDSDTGILTDVIRDSDKPPFQMEEEGVITPWACIIRKKEPEKKYVPFDLSKEEDRVKLRGAWVRRKDLPYTERLITAIEYNCITVGVYYSDAENLLEHYEFIDGSPCGKPVDTKKAARSEALSGVDC